MISLSYAFIQLHFRPMHVVFKLPPLPRFIKPSLGQSYNKSAYRTTRPTLLRGVISRFTVQSSNMSVIVPPTSFVANLLLSVQYAMLLGNLPMLIVRRKLAFIRCVIGENLFCKSSMALILLSNMVDTNPVGNLSSTLIGKLSDRIIVPFSILRSLSLILFLVCSIIMLIIFVTRFWIFILLRYLRSSFHF